MEISPSSATTFLLSREAQHFPCSSFQSRHATNCATPGYEVVRRLGHILPSTEKLFSDSFQSFSILLAPLLPSFRTSCFNISKYSEPLYGLVFGKPLISRQVRQFSPATVYSFSTAIITPLTRICNLFLRNHSFENATLGIKITLLNEPKTFKLKTQD